MPSRILFALCIFSFLPTSIRAQWLQNGTPVVATTGVQVDPAAVADGLGGVIFAWEDSRNGNNDIYAQRFNSSGVAQWTKDGVVVCTATGDQIGPTLIADGAGGAIIIWYDARSGNYDVYTQRISSSGLPQWTANGVAICTAADDQFITGLVTDGSGGAIISWDDERGGVRDVYARRITAAGSPQWTANGVPICAQAGFQDQSRIVSDGAGGAIIVWYDTRSGAHNYAQRVNGSGVVQWLLNGLIVCNIVAGQQNAAIASDGAGGVVIAWEDFRAISGPDIYAQRMNSSGSLLWAATGVVVTTVPSSENLPEIIWDNSIGMIAMWWDSRNTGFNMYAQRLNAAGAPQWKENGVQVSNTNGAYPRIISAGAGAGAIVAWFDADIRAQRVDAAGQIQWPVNGMPVTNDPGNQFAYLAMVSNGAGGAIMAWGDRRSGTAYDIYAQRIEGKYGYWGNPDPILYAAKDVPSDQGGRVRLEWYASGRESQTNGVITYYTIWRAIDQAAFAIAAASGVPVVDPARPAAARSGKALRHEKAQAVDYFWELIGQQDAFVRYAYSFTANTNFDSTATNSATHRFQVLAHADEQLINWPSNIITGRSVDNLAPPPPPMLTAQRTGNYVYLKWNGVRVPDLDKYTVYRATSSGVTPIPTNFLADEDDTLLTDSSAPATALYYIVTASDIHQNRSVKSNEAAVSAATSAGNLPPITALSVLQNHPNPFSGETTFSVGLPARADVSIEVYDVAGRRVRDYSLLQRAKGWSTIRLDGRDGNGLALPSGVYFYRVRAGVEAVTNKMVIAR